MTEQTPAPSGTDESYPDAVRARDTDEVVAGDERLTAVGEAIDDARRAEGDLHDADVLGDAPKD